VFGCEKSSLQFLVVDPSPPKTYRQASVNRCDFDGWAMAEKSPTEKPGLVICYSSPWDFDGPNRNRWFTELNSMVDLSMANCECHNQIVIFLDPIKPY